MSWQIGYWRDILVDAAGECGLQMTDEQLDCIAGYVQSGHENYGMGSPDHGWGDRFHTLEKEAAEKLQRLQAEFERYQRSAGTAVARAMRLPHDVRVTIGEHGEVFRHDGRTERLL